ncbi:MAG: DUF975 family protein [Oscillospiraceae bacterium]|nr:DUF975 family protein [Oscillospiraceae bacterium]
MAELNGKNLRRTAGELVSAPGSPARRLVLIHTGLVVVLNLVVSWLNLLLNEKIGTTGGLSGMGLRSVLETMQTLLSYFTTLFVPFWSAGFLRAMIQLSRSQETGPRDLLLSFRRFGRIISRSLLEMVILLGLCVGLTYLVTNVFLLTPFARDFLTVMNSLGDVNTLLLPDGSLNLELLPVEQLIPTMIPMFIMYFLAFLPAYAFLNYQFRMTLFLLVEGIDRSAPASFFASARLMKGHKWQMLKLDLHFWWFYVLEMLLTCVLYLDLILPALGIALPVNADAAFFITIALYGILELGLHYWKKPQVDLTYALAYDAIFQEALGKIEQQN